MTTSIHSTDLSENLSPELSPTTSVAGSMVSMKTEDHNELYDHRQQADSLPIRKNPEVQQDNSSEKEPHPSFRNANTPSAIQKNRFPAMEYDTDHPLGHRQLRTTEILTSNARPSRLSYSIAHQKQLFAEDRNQNLNKETENKKQDVLHDQEKPNPVMSLPKTHSERDTFDHQKRKEQGRTRSRSRTNSDASDFPSIKPLTHLKETISNHTSTRRDLSDDNLPSQIPQPPKKKQTRASFDSDASQLSGDSQETEEDVCFPMPPQLHTRVNGIDFDELEEFAEHCNDLKKQYVTSLNTNQQSASSYFQNGGAMSTCTSTSSSSAALKYTPKVANISQEKTDNYNEALEEDEHKEEEENKEKLPSSYFGNTPGVSFGNNKIEADYSGNDIGVSDFAYGNETFNVPDRFSFFCSESEETTHSPDVASLVKSKQSFYDLFRGGEPTWWLDCSCPTDDEMRCFAKAFGIHPLTAEDIRMQETREKVELFKSYYFVCFHTFENDKESEDFLEPINVYIVVFRSGVLSFHFGPISHCANVRRRVRQLRDYVNVNSDWLCYALIDDITDSFAPVIQSLEYEADAIEDSVFMARDMDFARMLQKIGESRRKTMTLMRLLSGKADVIKMFAKRCQDEANGIGPALTSQINIANLQSGSEPNFTNHLPNSYNRLTTQPRGDIALYLGDIQDHLLTMYQNLLSYEKIFSRSHSNYLAQLQVESFNSNNKVTEMLGKVTMIGTMLVPLNVITGLFGMNVKVPGNDTEHLGWWFGILGVLVFLAVCGWFLASFWIKRIDPPTTLNEAAESGSKSIISNFLPKNEQSLNKSKDRQMRSQWNHPSNKSIASLPSKYSRYD
ncbi:Mg(2+) transporter ALR1 NDAI_0G04130 [Naumovozyma dairenensis CBS 421]|uniref:Uncharacterized protein n=1 Tax=Naumovozyma dairenensis (strain ATCC 10597 / BCRC 20456 / CBS 421 / NBRC 0211 / NRRL Y-12639) TaxID=1071378 RepID=J7SAY4_NAUDC|nr:hypothetical protein NDAI_0G04130 [Naumovozyma dairenensis CBS 421]CCK73398.1 hypothetical protein NDAI_0G04130 [Naumovozyma dairenensis CBS 421]